MSYTELSWLEFENQGRRAMELLSGVELSSRNISINGKEKRFDLVNLEHKVVGDIKHYRTTSGGNRPSAKFSTLNEYVWLMQMLDKYTDSKWRKLLIIGEEYELVKKYADEFKRWLDDLEIYFYSIQSGLKRIR